MLLKLWHADTVWETEPGTRGFNKQQRPTKRVSYFAQRSWLLFSMKEEAPSAYDVINK